MIAPVVTMVSGREVSLLHPVASDIVIEDIAHHLAMQCRWVGAVRTHYSVAQHSVCVAGLCPPEARLWGLLHDASEAYLGDVSTPLKQAPFMAGYRAIEAQLQRVIFHRFGLIGDPPAAVAEADHLLLVSEAQDLLARVPSGWPEAWRAPAARYPHRLEPWDQARATRNFLIAFEKLTQREVAPGHPWGASAATF